MKKKDTRLRIMNAAEALFFEKGYLGVSVDEIVNSLGMSKATLYRYFKSKEELVETIASRFFKDVNDILLNLLNDKSKNFEEKLFSFVSVRAKMLKRVNPILIEELSKEDTGLYEWILNLRNELIEGEFRSFLRAGQMMGEIRNDVNLHVMILMVTTAIDQLTNPGSMLLHKMTYDMCFEQVMSIVWKGIKN